MCTLPVGMAAAGAAIGAIGNISAGRAAAANASRNAALYEQQAALRMEQAQYEIGKQDRLYRRQAGNVQAQISASGIDPRSFSDVLADDAAENKLAKDAIAWSAQNDASQLRFQAQSQRIAGRDAVRASYFGAASSIVGGFTNYYGMQARGVRASSGFAVSSVE